MKTAITRQEAENLLAKYIHSPHLKLHSLETEAVMRDLARHLWRDEDFWWIVGLLHDLDLDVIGDELSDHGNKTIEILKEEWYDIPEMFDAILAHTEWLMEWNKKRSTELDFCLAAGENITGLIYAYALMRPDKKIAWAEVSSIKKRLKELRFAANVNRAFIYDIEKAGITLDQFLTIALEAIKWIAHQIGI